MASAASKEKTFVVSVTVRSAKEFETFAAQAVRLKKHGRVEMNLRSLSGPAAYEVPAGGSAWHEYTTYLSTLLRVFPHPKIAPFIPAEYVRKNQQLLKSCAKVIRKYKLGAAFEGHEPFYINEKFFQKYPTLRGPRVDHPRRSRKEAFAMCIDQPEVQEIVAWMAAQLLKAVPEIGTWNILTNDAGAGLCWNDWIYSGPNGPANCQLVGTGPRMAKLVEAIRRGAGKKDLAINMFGNFSRNEFDMIPHYVDENFFFHARRPEPRTINTGVFTDNPVLGIVNVMGNIDQLQKLKDPQVHRFIINSGINYHRGSNLPEAAEKVIEIISAFLDKPAYGTIEKLEFLRGLCVKWVGKNQADALLEALVALRDAFAVKNVALPRFSANYVGVSMRVINRPLVAVPNLLTPEEEAYFLPYVFNINDDEARNDYIDCHGGRLVAALAPNEPWPRIGAAFDVCSRLNSVAGSLEKLTGKGDAKFFHDMGASLRIFSCILRSMHNFYSMQIIRDRNKEKFAAPLASVPPKMANWTGDPDLLMINEIMRDELDNTTEFIGILENGGIKRVAMAATPELEDMFLLGPDFVKTLKTKCKVMRDHWLDAERYLVRPHK